MNAVAIVLLFTIGLAAWAGITYYGFVPLLEALSGNDIPFWPTFLSAVLVAGWMQVKWEQKENR
ncbi:hypothetical protein [Corynebacterium glyciniphilum]|uniref:hypothetical protein n=1 Tax=Corynebacterium glyciniphilum TaxID=1404244 RepID=UPI002651C943|nr:hypothetical protein [Corynebacterium glyciniphilum]MDN6706922.1 hypothetical protein [Corynebacterium glyciniphilum]